MDKVHCLTARSSKVSAFCKKKPNLPQLLPFYRMYFKALACIAMPTGFGNGQGTLFAGQVEELVHTDDADG